MSIIGKQNVRRFAPAQRGERKNPRSPQCDFQVDALAGRLDQVVCDVAVNVARLSTKAKLPPEPDFVVDSDSIWEHYPRRIT